MIKTGTVFTDDNVIYITAHGRYLVKSSFTFDGAKHKKECHACHAKIKDLNQIICEACGVQI